MVLSSVLTKTLYVNLSPLPLWSSLSEPDILECEVQTFWNVKWALGSTVANKASGGFGVPAELFKILKDDAIKVLHSTCQ